MLKPVLARGELRTIAATTWSEYKKYFEKDAALARHFQPVKLDEPDVSTTILILRGLKEKYEKMHHVLVRDDAIVAAAKLSDRYIANRQLPDKAIDLLDMACARVSMMQTIKPAILEDKQRQIQALQREYRSLQRDDDHCQPVESTRLPILCELLAELCLELEDLTVLWEKQRQAAQVLLQARHADGVTLDQQTPEQLMQRKDHIGNAAEAFALTHGGQPLLHVDVDPDMIAAVISDWTGIPVEKMLRDQSAGLIKLEHLLRELICGQDEAVQKIVEILQSAQAGLRDTRQPRGVFLLVGSSGVGKTATALAIADILFGDERSAIVINMSEFQERHHISRLIGSPPG